MNTLRGLLLTLLLVGPVWAHPLPPSQDPFPPTLQRGAQLEGASSLHRVAIFLINYSDQVNTVPLAKEVATGVGMEGFYHSVSYGLIQVEVDVFGPYTVAQPSGYCMGFAPPQAEQIALDQGVPLDLYPHRVFVVPPSPQCAWGGTSVMGPVPNRAYINGTYDLRLHVHELGHLLDMQHSHSLSCPPKVSLCSPGVKVEYGDTFDIMGSGAYPRHPNAAQKIQVGWLTPVEAGPGVYTLTGLEQSPSALRIHRTGMSEDLVVEYRAAPIKKVLVHLQRSTPGPYLLKMSLNGSFLLPLGKVWTDPQTGQTLLLEVLTDTSARIKVGP